MFLLGHVLMCRPLSGREGNACGPAICVTFLVLNELFLNKRTRLLTARSRQRDDAGSAGKRRRIFVTSVNNTFA